MEIKDVAAIVTGAASGLGAATTRGLAERGARVFALDLATAIEKVTGKVDGVEYLVADVTDPDQVRAAVEAAAGKAPLRIAVSCAGIGTAGRVLSRQGPHDLAVFRRIVEVNLIGTFNVMRLAAQAMAQTEPLEDGQRGVIVNTASIAAYDGQIGQVAYAASKGGVASLTLPAARDLASFGIRVLTIAPGIVDTPMLGGVSDEFREGLASGVPFPKRLGRPEEYGQLAAFLVTHDYLNGEVIRMDGALRMAPR
jgi:NAD(P)-dependent dehydrogenase (short-subunit alcohol dehydrogenase family)